MLFRSVWSIIAIAIGLGVAIALGGGNVSFILYLVALSGMGMLATTGVIVSEDSFGPVADNAAGIAEMSGEFSGEPERIMVSLDAVGNTTKAVTKGFAIGSAVIAAVASSSMAAVLAPRCIHWAGVLILLCMLLPRCVCCPGRFVRRKRKFQSVRRVRHVAARQSMNRG